VVASEAWLGCLLIALGSAVLSWPTGEETSACSPCHGHCSRRRLKAAHGTSLLLLSSVLGDKRPADTICWSQGAPGEQEKDVFLEMW
jgi:hypothetical protein